ncbi:MAG TPA: Hsp33 family molecular chaperone HslO [Arenimonas sp.]|nr:Hsp33 family molecular chaperone HslO [Arenimonas sp.]
MSQNDDSLTRFMLDGANVRGALVKLTRTWQAIESRADYPAPVADYLAQCTAASALFIASIKIDGRLSIQMRGDGPIRTLFTECTTKGTLRGLAHFATPVPDALTLGDFGGDAIMAITIERDTAPEREPQRYQGLVGFQADTLAEAFEQYFEQSEQLPTRIVLFASGQQAVGLLIQQLPEAQGDPDDWQRAQMLFDTVSAEELFALEPNDLLYRLFHEESPRVLDSLALSFACSCSRERVENALISLGEQEMVESLEENGDITVHCDFCGQAYHFSKDQGLSLFWPETSVPGSPSLH